MFFLNKVLPLLPFDLKWKDIDTSCTKFIHRLYSLLNNNYVEDFYSFLRFNYVHEFLKFAISSPNWASFLNLGLKFNRTEKINGFITSNFRKIIIRNQLIFCSEINFLCLQKKLRKKLFVQVLIKEITRRINCFGKTKAVYTTGLPFLRPFLKTNYFYFSLKTQKQGIFNGGKFTNCSYKNQEMLLDWKKFNPKKKKIPNYRAHLKIMKKNFQKKKIYKHFELIDFFYWIRFVKGFKYAFINRNGVLNNKKSIISFYALACKTMKSKRPCYFYDAYFYYGTQMIERGLFITNTLVICKSIGFDLFYILDGHYNENFLLNSKFKNGYNRVSLYMLGLKIKIIEPLENALIFF